MKTDNSIALCGLMALAMPAEAATGYLPAIGPSPIYFRAPRPAGSGFLLPPLDMGRPPSNPLTQGKEPPDSASWAPPSANENSSTETASKSPAPGAAGPANAAVAPSARGAPTVLTGAAVTGEQPDASFLMPLTTQALIPFFTRQLNGDTNAPRVSVVLPVEFHPARPPEPPPSSSATFTQEKKSP